MNTVIFADTEQHYEKCRNVLEQNKTKKKQELYNHK